VRTAVSPEREAVSYSGFIVGNSFYPIYGYPVGWTNRYEYLRGLQAYGVYSDERSCRTGCRRPTISSIKQLVFY